MAWLYLLEVKFHSAWIRIAILTTKGKQTGKSIQKDVTGEATS